MVFLQNLSLWVFKNQQNKKRLVQLTKIPGVQDQLHHETLLRWRPTSTKHTASDFFFFEKPKNLKKVFLSKKKERSLSLKLKALFKRKFAQEIFSRNISLRISWRTESSGQIGCWITESSADYDQIPRHRRGDQLARQNNLRMRTSQLSSE